MPKRLLFVVNLGWFFASHRLPIALAAKRAGYEVHVAATFEEGPNGDGEQPIRAAGLNVHKLRHSRAGSSPIEFCRELLHLARLLRKLKPEIVHLVTLKPILIGGLACRLLGVPCGVFAIPGRGPVFSARGFVAGMRRMAVLGLYRLAYRPGRTRVIVQNVEDRDYFIARHIFRSSDVSLIRGSGVDPGKFVPQPEPAGVPVVLFAGRMIKAKGVEEFVAAAEELRLQRVPARFVLVGAPDTGSSNSYSRREIEVWAERGIVEWWGFRPDMENVFAACHIICLPTSYGEGVPKVLIEAAACGRPIVTTNIPGCSDIVRHAYNGLLVPPRDKASVVSALRTLITSEHKRALFGANGRRLVLEEFALAHIVKQTLDVYAGFGYESTQSG